MEFQIKELEIIPELEKAIKELKDLVVSGTACKQWWTLEETWNLKGGCSYSTFRNRRYFQCKGGIPDAQVNGRRVWSRESVMEWVKLTDDQLPEYHAKYKTGARRREVKKN